MKFILILLSMMLALFIQAIPIDVDVGFDVPITSVYLIQEQPNVPTEVLFELPRGVTNEMFRNSLISPNNDIEKREDFGSINEFVLSIHKINYTETNEPLYKGYNFGSMNKLL